MARIFPAAPALTRVDATLNYDFDNSAPVLPDAGPISARWTGFVTVPESGRYRIGLIATERKAMDRRQAGGGRRPAPARAQDGGSGLREGPQICGEDRTDAGARPGAEIRLDPGDRRSLGPGGGGRKVRRSGDCRGRHHLGAGRRGDAGQHVPGFVGGDRTSLDMPKDEEDLLKA